MADAKKNGSVSMHFDTWLVCEIGAKAGTAADKVGDDFCEVATLTGWTWGYDIVYKDVGTIGIDELVDDTFTMLLLAWIAAPTEDFRTGLGATYGDRIKDSFNIKLRECDKCVGPVPERSTFVMMLGGRVGTRVMPGRRRVASR